jgi:protein SCO1/2
MPKQLCVGVLCLLSALFCLTGCAGKSSEQERRFELHGKIVAVDGEHGQITVSHDAVSGYMDAMTMPFSLKDATLIKEMAPGDEISAQLVVDGKATWIENPIISRIAKDPASYQPTAARPEPSPGDQVPDFRLINQDGKEISLSKYRGKALALTFIYTRCPLPDYCILMNDNFARVESALSTDPTLEKKSHLLTVSFDPAHDTPAVMKTFGSQRIPKSGPAPFSHWEFATGTENEIRSIGDYFGLTYQPDSGQFVHSLRTAVITPGGKLFKLYRGNDWKSEQLVADLKSASLDEGQ